MTGDTEVVEAADSAEAFVIGTFFDVCEHQVERRDDRGE